MCPRCPQSVHRPAKAQAPRARCHPGGSSRLSPRWIPLSYCQLGLGFNRKRCRAVVSHARTSVLSVLFYQYCHAGCHELSSVSTWHAFSAFSPSVRRQPSVPVLFWPCDLCGRSPELEMGREESPGPIGSESRHLSIGRPTNG